MNYGTGDPRDQLARVGRSVVLAGLVVGSGGNLSVRVRGTDEFWVTAAGTWLDRLRRRDFTRVSVSTGSAVDSTAEPVEPVAPPTSEVALHIETYRVRPDVSAIVHLHPQSAIMLDAAGQRIRLVTTDHAFYLREVVSTPFHRPGTPELARVAADAVADGTNCVLLAHHGCSVLGDSVELAHKRALYLEEAARLTLNALTAGLLEVLPDCPGEYVGLHA